MTPSNDGEYPEPNVKPKAALSRREFLQVGGVFAGAAALLPVFSQRLLLNPIVTVPTDEEIEAALKIAVNDPMYLETLAALTASNFAFDASLSAVLFPSMQDKLVGWVLQQVKSESLRFGADLAFTVDLSASILTSIQTVIGWSLVDLLVVSSNCYDVRYLPYEDPVSPKDQSTAPPEIIRPSIGSDWTLPRPNSPKIQPEDFVEVGWPPHAEDPNAGYWHYGGCSGTAWVTDNGASIYRCVQVGEHLANTNFIYSDLDTDTTN